MSKETRKTVVPQGVDALLRQGNPDQIEEAALQAFADLMSGVRDRLLDATKIAWLALTLATVVLFCGEYRISQQGRAAVAEIEKHRDGWRAKVAQVEQMKDELSQRNAKAAQLILQLEALQRQRTPPQVSPNRISPNADEVSSL